MDADMEAELIAMGIASPVTKASAGAQYHRELSRQVRLLLRHTCPKRSSQAGQTEREACTSTSHLWPATPSSSLRMHAKQPWHLPLGSMLQ
jgi:hypothetical protein